MTTIGLFIFDGVEELDFVGPWEVFTMSNEMQFFTKSPHEPFRVLTVSASGGVVTCAKKMRVLADHSFADCPKLDVILVPGGQGTRREVEDKKTLDWIAQQAKGAKWVTSVCTGSLLLAAAGLTRERQITTHWAFVDTLRGRNEAANVRDDVRFVRDGNVVTAAGVSAGIDMALWLTGQLTSPDHARATQKGMQYDPAPPYAAMV